jgi:hypothetical protein
MRSVDLHPTRRVAIRNRAATVVLMIGFAVVGTGCGSSTGTGNPSTTIGITGNGPSSSSGATGGAGGAISDPSSGSSGGGNSSSNSTTATSAAVRAGSGAGSTAAP